MKTRLAYLVTHEWRSRKLAGHERGPYLSTALFAMFPVEVPGAVSLGVGGGQQRSGAVMRPHTQTLATPRAFRPPGLHRITARPDKWVDGAGSSVDDAAVLERLLRLAIPPAWVDVWASADANASVQATGVDKRGRTQYRYSAAALDLARDYKFTRMTLFAAAIPALRLQVARDMARYRQDSLGVRVVTAATVRLLER